MHIQIIALIICGIAATVQGAGHPGNVLNCYAYPRTGSVPLTVTFNNMSEVGYDSLAWDFGDGRTITDSCPIHTYTDPGTYTVTLYGYAGDSLYTVVFEDLIEARFLDPCDWRYSWDVPCTRMHLDNYLIDSIWSEGYVRLPDDPDSGETATASFVYDGSLNDEFWVNIEGIADSVGSAFIAMEVNGQPVFAGTLSADQGQELTVFETSASLTFGDTVVLSGMSDGNSYARLTRISIFVLADCFINDWELVWPDTVRLEPEECYTYTPWIFGCAVPCGYSYYFDDASSAMGIAIRNGTVSWRPTAADTGMHKVIVRNLPADRTDTLVFIVAKTSGIGDRERYSGGIPVTVRGMAPGGMVSLYADAPGTYGLQLMDGAGNELMHERTVFHGGLNRISVPPVRGAGLAFMHVSDGVNRAVFKVMLLP